MGGFGSNPSKLERFRSKPSELCPSFRVPECRTPALKPGLRWETLEMTLLSWDLTSNLIAQENCCFANTTSERKKTERVPHEL